MTPTYTLSRSALRNRLYFAAFGSASRDERRDAYCDSPKFILKRKRRELFNAMMKSEKGRELLRASATKYLHPNKINTLMANSAFKEIEVRSDAEDDEDDRYKSSQSQKTLWNDTTTNTKTTIRHKVVDRVRGWDDDDMFDYDERYPLETDQRSNAYENTCQESQTPTLSKLCRTTDSSHEVGYDGDDTDEEDICEKDYIRLPALKRYLTAHEGSIESDADWFDNLEQNEWSTTAEGSGADDDMYSMMDIDDMEIDDTSLIDYPDDEEDDDD
jgi:hypothetical protein